MPHSELLTIGEAFEDLVFSDLPRLPGPGEEVKTSVFRRVPGGGVVITAIAASRLGTHCGIVSGLSPSTVEFLQKEGVEITNLLRDGESYAISASLSTSSDRSFVTFNGINEVLESRLLKPAASATAKHVHFAFYPSNCHQWISILKDLHQQGITTSWDFGWNEGLLNDSSFHALTSALDFLFYTSRFFPVG